MLAERCDIGGGNSDVEIPALKRELRGQMLRLHAVAGADEHRADAVLGIGGSLWRQLPWLPNDCVFITEIPKTSTGKFSKRTLRDRYAAGELGS
jgi:acyl-CoA synthetase (AMP-forming)/AMP-acid ligase II